MARAHKDASKRVIEGFTSTVVPMNRKGGFVRAPDFMKPGSIEAEVFMELAQHCESLGIQEAVDSIQLTNYAILQAEFIKHYNEFGEALTTPSVLTALRHYSAMFGMDPMSRSRILVQREGKEEDKAEELRLRMATG